MTDTPTRADLIERLREPMDTELRRFEQHYDEERREAAAALTADAERIAALEEENAALKALQADEGEMLTIAWMDGAHRSKQTYRERIAALEGEVVRLREALRVLRDLPIVENDNPDTLHIDGAAYQGPAVDFLFRIVRKIKMIARAALKGTDHDRD